MDNETLNLRAGEMEQAACDFLTSSRVVEKYRAAYSIARQQLKDSIILYASCGYEKIFSEFMADRTDVNLRVNDIINTLESDGLNDIGMSLNDVKELNDKIGDAINTEPPQPFIVVKEELIGIFYLEKFWELVYNHARHLRMLFLTALIADDKYVSYRGEAWNEVYQYIDMSFRDNGRAIAFANITESELARPISEFNSLRVLHAMRDFQRGG